MPTLIEATHTGPHAIKVERRAFLKASTGVLAVAAMGPIALFGSGSAVAASGDFSREHFDALVGEWFQIDADSWNSLELVDVEAHDGSPRVDQFLLTFRGSPHFDVAEGTYDFSQPDGSMVRIHIQPAGSDEYGSYYRAPFAIIKPITYSCAPAA